MVVLHSQVDKDSETFRRNREAYDRQRVEIATARAAAIAGGDSQSRNRHRSRGKLLARERVAALLDPGTPFLELGQLCGHDVYDDEIACAGIVTGIGIVSGRACAIVANDATVKGGTYYPLTIKKHIRAQQVARENGLTCIYLVDSGGAFLPMQEDIFPDERQFGSIFRSIAELSALGLRQISAVLGSCTAGGAYIPAMSDETIIVRDTGTIFLGGPQLVRAATGTVVDAETLGGADVHTQRSGVADHYALNDLHALALVRDIVARPGPGTLAQPPLKSEPPLYHPTEIAGIISSNPREPIVAREMLARLLDGSRLVPYRERYGTTVVCGTGAIGGFPVGVIINDGVLFAESAQKAANFIELCSQNGTPLVFFHNISGFMVGPEYEAGGIAKDGAKMINAVSCSRVPKFSVLIGGSYGAGNFAMCGRAFGPRLMAMWPNARTSVMGGEQAATVLSLVRAEQLTREQRSFPPNEEEAFKQPIRDSYDKKGRPLYAAARLWIDAVLDPTETREWLALGLALAAGSAKQETRFGVFRM